MAAGSDHELVCHAAYRNFPVPTSAYALLAAYRRQPVRAIPAGGASMTLKFWFVGAIVRRYDARETEVPVVDRGGRDE